MIAGRKRIFMEFAVEFARLTGQAIGMNFLQTALAAGVVIPGVVATSMFLVPTEEDRQAQAAEHARIAAIEKYRNEEESHLFVLQPFYISGGVFIVELEARGAKGQSVLCGNLPLLHDAVVTALYGKTASLSTKRIQETLAQYGEGIRRQVNGAFERPMLKRVVLSYSDLRTFNANYARKKTGSAKRCVAARAAG
jgi:hypothetical protein